MWRLVVLLGVAGCDRPAEPELKTFGSLQPICVVGCFIDTTIVDTREGADGSGLTLHKTQNIDRGPDS